MTDNNNIIRSDFFLTPEEYYRKRANIIEELKKCSIDIGYHDDLNSIQEKEKSIKGERKYHINIQTPVDPCIPKKTAVYHELSHALWDSFVSGSIDILKQWSKETLVRLLQENKIPNCNTQMNKIPAHITSEITQAQNKIENFIATVYMNCFNCLEDQRIESLTKNVWLATRGMFRQALTNCGNQMNVGTMKTPSDHLLAPRFFRPELTTPEYRKAVKDVEGTGMTGALVVMQTIKELIDKHIEENLDNSLKVMKRVIENGGKLSIPINIVNEHQKKKASRASSIGNAGSTNARITRYEQAIKGSGLTPAQKKDAERKIKKYRTITKKVVAPKPKTEQEKKIEAQITKQDTHKETLSKTTAQLGVEEAKENCNNKKDSFGGHEDIGNTVMPSKRKQIESTSLEQSRKQAQKEVNNILEKILTSGSPKEPAHIVEGVIRSASLTLPDTTIANQLSRTFDKIRQSKRSKLSETGSELDIEALIQSYNKGFGEYMIEEVKHKGLTIYVSIDGSGSMRHMNHMGEARNLVATMFKAVERVPSVKILANVWSSNTKGEVGISTVKTLNECKRISIDNHGFYYTPTHEAIRYTAKQMGNYSGKKLMIIITDGIPQYHKNGTAYSNAVLVNMAQKEYRKAQKYCRNIMCINISQESRSKDNLRQIFKRNYVEFNGMVKAKQFVLKNFRRTVFETLRR